MAEAQPRSHFFPSDRLSVLGLTIKSWLNASHDSDHSILLCDFRHRRNGSKRYSDPALQLRQPRRAFRTTVILARTERADGVEIHFIRKSNQSVQNFFRMFSCQITNWPSLEAYSGDYIRLR